MNETYIFGHRNPDTDSICAAITLSYLKNKLGDNTIPCRLGEINDETKYALDYFKVEAPTYLNDVKLTLSDVDFHKNLFISEYKSFYEAYQIMKDNNISGIPAVDESNTLVGMVTLKEILSHMINDELRSLRTSYDNILDVIEGKELLRFDGEIRGNLKLASFRSTTVKESVIFDENDILILADRHSIIEQAINSKVKLIILASGARVKDEHLELAQKNKVNIIKTKLSTFYVSNRIYLSNYIKNGINKMPYFFKTNDYVSEFKNQVKKIKHTNYPIVDTRNKCVGVLRMADVDTFTPKKVILVDHNEVSQSVEGLNEANIIEVVDHHKIGNVSSKNPINFRNMAVGSTNTIIYKMYKENKVKIPYEMAGLMLSGILSDTLLLKSPTTTHVDEEVVSELESILDMDVLKYGLNMYKAGIDIKGKNLEDVVNTDYKEFETTDYRFGVSQIYTVNIDEINENKEKFISILNDIRHERNLLSVSMFVTDITRESSYVYYDDGSARLMEDAFEISDIYQGYEIKDILSRKKQIVPKIMSVLEK